MNSSKISKYLEDYAAALTEYSRNNVGTIPFCAAEPILSDFTKSPFRTDLAERYIKSGIRRFEPNQEFIGSEYLYEIYKLVSEVCLDLFSCDYADARPLSGMNAALTTLMALSNPGDRVLLLHPDSGGHESFPAICERLSLEIEYIPFDNENVTYNLGNLEEIISNFDLVLIPPSDIISPPPIEAIDRIKKPETIIIYDCTQSLGFIASGDHPNPLGLGSKIVLTAGTHKTISGPACGLLLCNHEGLINELEPKITPIYVRNPHPHHIASLFLALVEFLGYGKEFMNSILTNIEILGSCLSSEGFILKNTGKTYSFTHQLFLSLSKDEAENIDRLSRLLNISLDKKNKKIYGEAGVRLGLQAVTRLGWDEKKLRSFGNLMSMMRVDGDFSAIKRLANDLRGKNEVKYSMNVNF